MSGKLKGIFDAFDHGNYKQAAKLCATLLKKEPGNALCKALHAVSLERCGRRDEALRLCDEVQTLQGADDTVLSNLKVVYRRCRRLRSIVQLWEGACKKDPDSVDFAERLFVALQRVGDHARAQQVATKLFSKSKREKYLHWTVVAMQSQAKSGADPKVLELAALMLRKAPLNVDDLGKGEDVPFNRSRLKAVLLELDLLRMRKKFDEALELLEKCREIVKYEPDVAALRLQLLVEAGRPKEATLLAKTRCLKKPGEWGFVQEYLQLAFACPVPEAAKRRTCGGVEIVDHAARLRPDAGGSMPSVATAEETERLATEDEVFNAALLVEYLRARADGETNGEAAPSSADASRTARLARLELRRQALAAAEAAVLAAGGCNGEGLPASDEDVAAFSADVKDFLARFGGKAHCFFDLKPFLCVLPDSDLTALLAAARDGDIADARRAAEAAKTEARLARALQRGGCGSEAEVEALLAATGGGSGDGQRPPEELMLLAVARLADLDRAAGPGAGRVDLLSAIAVAELGIEWYPQAYNFKALLVLLNGSLGLPNSMMKWYNQLGIKNGQHESASYLAFDELCLSGDVEQLHDVTRNIMGFHEDYDKDADEALIQSYGGSSLHRTAEYLESLQLRERSLLWGRAVVEETFCEVGQAKTWEEVLEALSRQSLMVDAVKARGDEHWLQRSQDRNILNGLHPLPLCTPLSTSRFSAQAWRRGGCVPTASLQAGRVEAVSSAAAIWGPVTGEVASPCAASASSSRRHQPSALEEQLQRGCLFSPTELTLSAAMLCMLQATLRPEGANTEQALVALETVHTASERAGLQAGAAPLAGEMPRRRSLRLAVTTCEAAGAAMRAAAGEPAAWAAAEAGLTAAAAEVSGLVSALATAEAFAFGHRGGVETLWAWLHSALAIVLPLASGLTAVLPKVGKKAKEGSEGLHAARVALRNLLAALQTSLADVQLQLASALQAAAPEPPAAGGALGHLEGGLERRTAVAREAAEAHRQHLRKLQESAVCRGALLKARGAFKP